jgi:hypothetical protein
VPPDALAQATEELLIAEGSDWFWWYGDDRSSAHDREFDDLFRRHLRNVYALVDRPVPDELFVTNISTEPGDARVAMAPFALLTPTIDGEDTSYFEWLGAGRFEVVEVTGAMHQATRRRRVVGLILFGFDRHAFHVRIEGPESMREVLDQGTVVSLEFLTPAGLRAVVRGGVESRGALLLRDGEGAWLVEPGAPLPAAAGRVIELSVPIPVLGRMPEIPGLSADTPERLLRFFVTLKDPSGAELERHPSAQPITVSIPDAAFESRHWRA